MSWTRTAVARAGLAGAVGATLVLSTIPSLAATPSSPTSTTGDSDADTLATVLAGAPDELPLDWSLASQQVAAAESRRDMVRASRASERVQLTQEQQKAQAQAERRAERRAEREAERKAAAAKRAERQAAAASREQARQAVPSTVVGERWTTAGLNVRATPDGAVVTTLPAATKVSVTNRADGSWQQIRWDGVDRWVAGRYLSTSKPAAPRPASSSSTSSGSSGSASGSAPTTGTCVHGAHIESGITANARAVYRAVCNRWPQITGYGGYRPDGGYHGSGRAVDVMVSGPLGWDIANWVRANAGSLGVSEIIYAQQIWTVQRSGEGWRWMSDRGSATANHYDHVHISVY